ncbi:hypothetical protein NW752_010940 [Fusarium irregulare]|uniref:Uncharacterized protein n=1 Tax=Fusarium irregulare TaxID=2494466 RepID=A0A9W8PEA6_9HYPO|nr:hypothetical protein NW766_011829 [Fusarium irregulare]KAJ4006291.1 hypothetical protein NW752_010940 [Fusarium irregulare]
MPSKTVTSDASSTNATYGSTEPASKKQTDTSLNIPAGLQHAVSETKQDKNVRQNEMLIGIGSQFTSFQPQERSQL